MKSVLKRWSLLLPVVALVIPPAPSLAPTRDGGFKGSFD